MGIVSLVTDVPGQIGDEPRRPKLLTTVNLATLTTAGYLNSSNLQGQVILPTDIIDCWYGWINEKNPGTFGSFSVTIANGVITLVATVAPGDVLLPVVSGDFAVFNGTTGQIKDAGFLPTDNTKTRVVMQSGASVINNFPKYNDVLGTITDSGISPSASTGVVPIVATPTIANHIAVYTDVAGSLGEDAATAINAGNIQAGTDAVKGQLIAYGGALNGHIIINPIGNTGNTNITIENAIFGQDSVLTIPDPGTATADFVLAPAALVSGNINQASSTAGLVIDSGIAALNVSIMKVFTLTFAQLAAAAKVNIQVHSSGTSQYFIQDIKILNSTGLSGGGGDRLLAVTDGTLGFNDTGITAALLGTPIFTLWGGTGNPIANGTSQISTAGADIYFQYAGGTTDYTAGSVQIAVTYVKVTI